MTTVWTRLRSHPVIPAVWDEKALHSVTQIPAAAVFLQFGSLFNLRENCERLKAHSPGIAVFFHIELADGIAADEAGIRFVRSAGADGIVATKPGLIEAARKVGLATILRLFVQDSRSVRRAVQMAQRCSPDALDLLPGPVVPEVMADLRERLIQPIIAGGLVRRPEQVRALLKAGCLAVDTSTPALWGLDLAQTSIRRSAL